MLYSNSPPPCLYDAPGFQIALNNALHADYVGISVSYPSRNNVLTISISGQGHTMKIFTDGEIPIINKYMVSKGITWNGNS